MPAHRYPDLYGRPDRSWSGGLSRFLRMLRLVAFAGAIGAAGGGLGAFAILGTGSDSPRQDVRADAGKIPANATDSVSSGLVAPKAASLPPAMSSAASAGARLHAVQANEPAVGQLYDRAEPAASGADAARRSALARARARIRARRRIARRPMPILPSRDPAFSEYQGGDWRGGFFAGDDWRN